MRKQGKTSFDDMLMSSFGITMVLRSVRWTGEMRNFIRTEMRGEFDEFSTIIREETFNFSVEKIFNKFLKSDKDIEGIRIIFERVKPYIFGVMTNKYYIVFSCQKMLKVNPNI